MKRLVALLAAIAVLMSMSLTSFAAFSDEIADNGDGTYTAALSASAATANAGKQTTIVAYKGNTISVGSIQYIDQAAATSFTFQLKDELTEDVKVVMGGEAIEKQEIGTIVYDSGEPEPSTYTISGSVANFVEEDYYEMLVDEELIDAADADTYRAQYTTIAYLATVDAAIESIDYYGDDYTIEAIDSCEVSSVDGTFEFTDVADGDYAVVIARDGALPYMEYATVDGANVSLGEIEMILGDVTGAKDFLIDAGDLAVVFDALGDITEEQFVAACDIAHDCLVDAGDLAIIFANLGDITAYGTDFIAEIFG